MGRSEGFPTTSRHVLCVDFDGTLFPWDDLFADREPIPGAVDGMRRLKEAGYHLVIFSSRFSDHYTNGNASEWAKHYDHVARMMDKYGIPYDDVSADKRPAYYYIDDRALPLWTDNVNHPLTSNWDAIANRLAPKVTHDHEWFQGAEDKDPRYVYCVCGELSIRNPKTNYTLADFYASEQDPPSGTPSE